MAAHLKTGTEQVLDYVKKAERGELDEEWLKTTLASATNLSCWTEDDTRYKGVWQHLYEYSQGDITLWALEQHLHEDMEHAKEEWEGLGQPRTREEWLLAKYPYIKTSGG